MPKTETAEAPTEQPAKQDATKQRKRLWCCVRIVDYRLQGLAPSDPEDKEGDQDWCDIGGDTAISADREAVFQLARAHGGLLMSCNGLPSSGRMAAFQAAAKAKEQEA